MISRFTVSIYPDMRELCQDVRNVSVPPRARALRARGPLLRWNGAGDNLHRQLDNNSYLCSRGGGPVPQQQPQQSTVIVQQSQSQTQKGCCAVTGCGTIFAIFLLLAGASVLWEAMMGAHGLGWQIGSWAGSIILVLLLVGGAVVALDQKFGWGLTDPPSDTPDTPRAHTQTPEDVLTSDAPNYRVAESRSPQEAERSTQERHGQWQPHPDDPLQPPGDAPAGVPPEREEQTEYAVVLQDAGAKKIKVIKVIRAATELGLMEAKALVDDAPNIVKEDLSREEAEALKAELERAGATVELW